MEKKSDENTIIFPVRTALYDGWAKSLVKNFVVKWKGGKISLQNFLPLIEFLRAKSRDHEITAVLYYNTFTGEWKPWVYPQEFGTGLSVRTLPDHENTDKQKRQYFPDDQWSRAGTVHSHCKIGAFQSSTDEADERDIGLHITFGKIDQPKIDMHARFVSEPNGGAFPVALETFFDISPLTFFQGPTPGIVFPNISIEDWLTSARMELPSWPKEWDENLIEKKFVFSARSVQYQSKNSFYDWLDCRESAREDSKSGKKNLLNKFRGVLTKK